MSTTYSTTKLSYSHLSAFERGQIKAYLNEKLPLAEIARKLNRHRSTIFREIKRGSVPQLEEKNGKQVYKLVYFPDTGQRVYEDNRENCRYLKLEHCSKAFIQKLERALKEKPRCHSVDSFVHTYKREHPLEVIPSTKTIYRYIHEGLLEVKPIDLPKAVRLRPRSKAKLNVHKRNLGMSIEERPEQINDRSEFGHWEIDLVLGKKTRGEAVVMTLVERVSRYALACKLPDKQAQTITSAVCELVAQYPILSITADNGSEFSQLSSIQNLPIYFAHPYSSHERGSNENFNGLLREYLPKGESLNSLSDGDLISYLEAINNRPRRLHNYHSAKIVFGLAQTAS